MHKLLGKLVPKRKRADTDDGGDDKACLTSYIGDIMQQIITHHDSPHHLPLQELEKLYKLLGQVFSSLETYEQEQERPRKRQDRTPSPERVANASLQRIEPLESDITTPYLSLEALETPTQISFTGLGDTHAPTDPHESLDISASRTIPLPPELMSVIATFLEERKDIRNLLYTCKPMLNCCYLVYFARVTGLSVSLAEHTIHINVSDTIVAIRSLYLWPLIARREKALLLNVVLSESDLMALQLQELADVFSSLDAERRIFPYVTLNFWVTVPSGPFSNLLLAVPRTGCCCLKVYGYPPGDESTSIELPQDVFSSSSITELTLHNIDISSRSFQDAIRSVAIRNKLTVLDLDNCGDHQILLGLKLASLRQFSIDARYGLGTICSFLSDHPDLHFVNIRGVPTSSVPPFVPYKPGPSLRWMRGSVFILHHSLFSASKTLPIHSLQVVHDIPSGSTTARPDYARVPFVQQYEEYVFRFLKQCPNLRYLCLQLPPKAYCAQFPPRTADRSGSALPEIIELELQDGKQFTTEEVVAGVLGWIRLFATLRILNISGLKSDCDSEVLRPQLQNLSKPYGRNCRKVTVKGLNWALEFCLQDSPAAAST